MASASRRGRSHGNDHATTVSPRYTGLGQVNVALVPGGPPCTRVAPDTRRRTKRLTKSRRGSIFGLGVARGTVQSMTESGGGSKVFDSRASQTVRPPIGSSRWLSIQRRPCRHRRKLSSASRPSCHPNSADPRQQVANKPRNHPQLTVERAWDTVPAAWTREPVAGPVRGRHSRVDGNSGHRCAVDVARPMGLTASTLILSAAAPGDPRMLCHLTPADHMEQPWAHGRGRSLELLRVEQQGALLWRRSRQGSPPLCPA